MNIDGIVNLIVNWHSKIRFQIKPGQSYHDSVFEAGVRAGLHFKGNSDGLMAKVYDHFQVDELDSNLTKSHRIYAQKEILLFLKDAGIEICQGEPK